MDSVGDPDPAGPAPTVSLKREPRLVQGSSDNKGRMLACTMLWIVALCGLPGLLYYWFTQWFDLNPSLPPEQADHAFVAIVWFAIAAVVVPAIGMLVARSARFRIQAGLFAVVFLLGVVADVFVLDHHLIVRPRQPPQPAPVVTQCIARSDGGPGCPGG